MIKEFIEKFLCKHAWEEMDHVRYFDGDDDIRPIYLIKLFKCRICGKFKKIKI